MSQDYIQDSYHYYDSSIITYPALSGGTTTKFPFKVGVVNAADANQNPNWKITVGDGFVLKNRLIPVEFQFDGDIRFDIQVADRSPIKAEQGIVFLRLNVATRILDFGLDKSTSVLQFPDWKPYEPEDALKTEPPTQITHSRYPLAVVEQRGSGANIQWFVYQLVYSHLCSNPICYNGIILDSFLPL